MAFPKKILEYYESRESSQHKFEELRVKYEFPEKNKILVLNFPAEALDYYYAVCYHLIRHCVNTVGTPKYFYGFDVTDLDNQRKILASSVWMIDIIEANTEPVQLSSIVNDRSMNDTIGIITTQIRKEKWDQYFNDILRRQLNRLPYRVIG